MQGAARLLRIVVGRSVALAGLGLALGIAAAFALGRVLQSQLFGVNPMDPITLAVVALVPGTTAAAASYLPPRAASLDPAAALRES